jgi:hypothetical protein
LHKDTVRKEIALPARVVDPKPEPQPEPVAVVHQAPVIIEEPSTELAAVVRSGAEDELDIPAFMRRRG